jgi:hypothetical protein
VSEILLGYEIGSGKPVSIPLRHLCATGQTQEAGKTTALEALIGRSGRRAAAFLTKRGEKSFESGRRIPPYFQERVDWEFVESILEAIMRQKMKFERAWIVRATKGAHSLADVHSNVGELMGKSKRGMDQDIYMLLGAYLDKIVPLLARLPKADRIDLQPGLNVMDLLAYPVELQMLIIASSVRWIHQKEEGVITILPEAWKFAPQGRNSPVLTEVRNISREGAGLKNYLWVDSQDIAGVEKEILRAAAVWLLGVQREANEIERALKSIPKGIKRPDAGEIPRLGLGEFFACWGQHVKKVYVQPEWMSGSNALNIAMGTYRAEDFSAPPRKTKIEEHENMDYKAAYEESQREVERLKQRLSELELMVGKKIGSHTPQPAPVAQNSDDSGEEIAMSLDVKRPVIDVTKHIYVIEASDDDQFGRIALLVSEGFFDSPKQIEHINREFITRGWAAAVGRPSPKNLDMAKLAEYGFVLVVGTGTYQSVPGMKVNVKEVRTVA